MRLVQSRFLKRVTRATCVRSRSSIHILLDLCTATTSCAQHLVPLAVQELLRYVLAKKLFGDRSHGVDRAKSWSLAANVRTNATMSSSSCVGLLVMVVGGGGRCGGRGGVNYQHTRNNPHTSNLHNLYSVREPHPPRFRRPPASFSQLFGTSAQVYSWASARRKQPAGICRQ